MQANTMAKMLTPTFCIVLWAIVLLNFASTSTPQTTISDHSPLPLSGFQQATTSLQPLVATTNSSSQLPLPEFQQLSSDSDEDEKDDEKEKKEEEKERKKEEKERKKEEKEREKEEKERKKEEKEREKEEKERKKEEKEREKEEKKKKKDCSLAASSIKQSNDGLVCMISLALFFYF